MATFRKRKNSFYFGKKYSIPLFHEMHDITTTAKDNNSVHRRNTLIAG